MNKIMKKYRNIIIKVNWIPVSYTILTKNKFCITKINYKIKIINKIN